MSKLLRSKVAGKNSAGHKSLSIDYDHEIEKNFWQYVKRQIKKASEVLPTFSKESCFRHFKTLFHKTRSVCTFEIPIWMPSYDKPKKAFNIQAPTYKEKNNIIYKMKTASAPCPLDQISVVTLKRCPYLRIYLLEIIKTAWSNKVTPEEWKKAITILIHKRVPLTIPKISGP